MSNQITRFRIEVDFENGYGGHVEMEDMELDVNNLEQFLVALKEPIVKMSEYKVGEEKL